MNTPETPELPAPAPVRVQRLSAADWGDVADLLWQFAQQCDIAFEDHRPAAKRWLGKKLQAMSLAAEANAKARHPADSKSVATLAGSTRLCTQE